MPVFNEQDRIIDFIQELLATLHNYDLNIVVVDDASSDSTVSKLRELAIEKTNIELIFNRMNLGHGGSTLKGLKHSLRTNADLVVTVDGDGNVESKSVLELIELASKLDANIAFGNRANRNDPIFRKITTFAVRVLIFLKSGKFPKDGNTPFRVYKPNTLVTLLDAIPENSRIPNILLRILIERKKIDYIEQTVITKTRFKESQMGTTWNQRIPAIPSKKYIKFAKDSLIEVWRFK